MYEGIRGLVCIYLSILQTECHVLKIGLGSRSDIAGVYVDGGICCGEGRTSRLYSRRTVARDVELVDEMSLNISKPASDPPS
jgi:hypothetical protein